MTLQHAISEISHITGDNLSIQRVSHALSNKVFKLISEHGEYGLRLNNPNSDSLGIDRDNEASILKLIEKHPWSPKVEYISRTLLLSHWYQRKTTTGERNDLSLLMDLLASVHQVPLSDITNLQTMNVTDHIQKYISQIETPVAFINAVTNFCYHYQFPEDKVLCHHDWHEGNLIMTNNELILLDWEYAAIGDPLIDIACFINGLELKEPEINTISKMFNLNRQCLQQALTLTQLMSFAWYMVRFPNKDWTEQIQSWISRLK
jgi:thiamine kinase-like enzyme